MGLGFLNIPYESIVLQYDDESTPLKLSGLKMLPIIETSQGIQNESLIILKNIDEKNLLKWATHDSLKNEVENLLKDIGNSVHSLCMPYWVWTPEFSNSSRSYFQDKKEVTRGPFKKLIANKEQYLNSINDLLEREIKLNLSPFYRSQHLTIVDIMIASHLWGMYIFPEFQFSPEVHNYLQTIKKLTKFDYHADFWK
jgi:glutaredoxin 2